MEKVNKEIKAEDILANDLAEGQLLGEPHAFDSEYLLAKDIRQAIEQSAKTLSPDNKDLLGNKIAKSIAAMKRREMIIRFSSAAAILLVASLTAILTFNKDSEIKTFAQSVSTTVPERDTKLILASGKEIQIETSEPTIKYGIDGSQININSSENIVQPIDNNSTGYNTVIVPYGKRAQLILAENSSVWLNSGSKLVYPTKFASKRREVYLEGEAIFEVSRNNNQPFYVLTQTMEVKVLGTVFDVCAYKDDTTTSAVLEKGSVELKFFNSPFKGPARTTLTPGTLAVYDHQEQSLQQSAVNTRLYTSWRDGIIICEHQTLNEIFNKISRYYNVSIVMNDKGLGKETFTGNLDLKNSARQVLELIGEIINAQIEEKENSNEIIITRI